MHPFFHKLFSGIKNLGSRRRSNRRPPRPSVRPALEGLEDRALLSTLFLVPATTPADATHFHRFQDAYGAAVNGDIIQVEPGASVRSVGIVTAAIAGVQAGANTITFSQRAHHPIQTIGPGEVVEVFGGGGNTEEFLVNRAQYIVHHILGAVDSFWVDTVLTLDAPFQTPHAAGATVRSEGVLGIEKSITLQGDPSQAPGEVDSNMVVAGLGTQGVSFNHLQFTGHELVIPFSAHSVTVTNSAIGVLSDEGFNNRFDGNTFGAAALDADNDQFTNNLVTGGVVDPTSGNPIPTGLSIGADSHNVLVQGNTFAMARTTTALVGIRSEGAQGLTIRNNSITLATNTPGYVVGIFLDGGNIYGIPDTTIVENNTIDTSGKGTGLTVISYAGFGSPVSALVQGNDFRNNAIGVGIWGDGTTAGNIDLGGGTLGSLGQNNFQSFTPQQAALGNFAISLHLTAASGPGTRVFALNNLWSVADPTQVVRDGSHNTSAPENSDSPSNGTGLIIVSQMQVMPVYVYRGTILSPIGK